MKISQDGLDLIKHFEGFYPEAYLCPAKVWTIGYGHTGGVERGDVVTEEEASALLDVDLDEAEHAVNQLVTVELEQCQFDALVSFTFNCGAGSLKESTLLRLLNQGGYEGARQQFARWNKANGKVLPGLTNRRAAEAEMFGGKV